ncbi:MAG: polyprenyl synthetase family protein [Alphaproteobacteria bacterium]|nr:polyprenyl synthetase family protein [Alphaproteobacteria bacterium]
MASYLPSAISEVASSVDKVIEAVMTPSDAVASELWEAMRYASLSGGKRLRPFFVVQFASLCGVEQKHSLRTAAAVEMIHSYSLVHDDLPAMDDDDIRRGKPTVHKKYDEATAILAGDALQSLAFELLSEPITHPSPSVRCELIYGLAKASGGTGMAGGQMLDLNAHKKDWNKKLVNDLQLMKTAALFGFACEAGAILGESSTEEKNTLKKFGVNFGLAFQITDDLLDITGNERLAGKALGKDEAKGKATFVELDGIDGALKNAAKFCHNAMEILDLYGDNAEVLRDIVRGVIGRQI